MRARLFLRSRAKIALPMPSTAMFGQTGKIQKSAFTSFGRLSPTAGQSRHLIAIQMRTEKLRKFDFRKLQPVKLNGRPI